MSPERRRQGRAIRKQRREAREAAQSLDWTSLTKTAEQIAEAFLSFTATLLDQVSSFVASLERVVEEVYVKPAMRQARLVWRAEHLVNQDC